jgi:hypothetical protein
MSTILQAGNATSGAVVSSDTAGSLQIQTGSTPTTAITIDGSQNVGIGTTSPTSQLHVSNSTGNLANFIRTFSNSGTTLNADNGGGIIAPAGAVDGLQFYNLGLSRLNMKIDSSGNVFINQSTGATGNGRLRITANSSTQDILELTDTYTSTGGYFAYFLNSSGNGCGGIQHNGTTTVNYVTSSDYRLKENVEPMINALERIAKLKPVTYTWKNTENELGEGFIAHELAEVFPIAVSGEKDAVNENGFIKAQGIDTSKLVAALVSAIQELNAKVDAQAAEIAALKGAK